MEHTDSLTDAVSVQEYTGEWSIDRAHSTVSFAVKHAMVAKVRGTFAEVAGSVTVEPDGTGSANATIEVSSLNTGVEARDNHLRSADFFDAEQYPQITFVSTAVTPTGATTFDLAGDLTIKGVTRPIVLASEFLGAQRDQHGKLRAGFEAEGKISRKEYGLSWNVALEAGGVLVSDTISVQLDIAVVRNEAG